MAATLTQTV